QAGDVAEGHAELARFVVAHLADAAFALADQAAMAARHATKAVVFDMTQSTDHGVLIQHIRQGWIGYLRFHDSYCRQDSWANTNALCFFLDTPGVTLKGVQALKKALPK